MKFLTLGGLLVLAGHLEKSIGVAPAWSTIFAMLAVVLGLLAAYNAWALPAVPNAEGSGYYRFTLDRPHLLKLAEVAGKELAPRERISFIGDLSALLDAGVLHGDDYLAALAHFADDPVPQVISSLLGGLGKVRTVFVTDALKPRYAAYIRRTLAPAKARFGLVRKPGEEDSVTLFRPRLIEALGQDGDDEEVVAFATELRSPSFSNVPGVFATIDRASLIEALTLGVYTAGAGHSAMHFPMIDLYTYAPTQCESAWSPPLRTQAEGTPTRFRETLPPVTEALENFYQVEIGHFRYDVFGDFSKYAIGSLDAVRPAVDALTAALAALATSIDARERNAPPRRGYPYLHPSLVTNSVNI